MRHLWKLALPLALTALASAQNVVNGNSGANYLPGSDGEDIISSGGGSGDVLHDAADPGHSDGVHDFLNAKDGEKDFVFAGPEDTVLADDKDWITIRDTEGNTLFNGTGKAYFFQLRLLRLIENWINDLKLSFEQSWQLLGDMFVANTDPELDDVFAVAAEHLAGLEAAASNSTGDASGE